MQFGWINATGALIVVLMLVPNIVWAVKNPNQQNLCKNRFMNILEQVGRYGSMALMVLPLGVSGGEFGYRSAGEMIVWCAVCSALMLAYWICWTVMLRRGGSLGTALPLAIIPSVIFIARGLVLAHWPLAAAGVIFAIGHIYITCVNNRPDNAAAAQSSDTVG